MIFYDHVDEMELFNDAMEASGMAWWLFEHPTGLIFFHPNKLKMLGYDAKDAEKFVHISKFVDLMHPDDIESTTGALGAYLEGKTDDYQADYRMKTKNGEYKRFYDRGKIVGKRPDGQIAVAGFAMDLTQSKLMPRPAQTTELSNKS
ncbi:MAG: PAS domain-containing protein [Candidatus Nomurabacteria bacterium]|nr:MAG: PAS domain-containing protein [Candidatus Nomurabacteria bacterium]